MTTDGFSVSNKATKEGNSDAFDLGVKLQPTESCPFNTMMVHHVHPYRPFPSNGISDGNGATCDIKRPFTNDTCDVVSGGVCGAAVAASVGAVGVRSMQPFDISPTEATTTAFKSPGRMAASLGFPFTIAQWKELERQAMIYKYMTASLPVPLHLLMPAPRNILPLGPAAPHSPLGSVVNLRFTNRADLEPGRCRRTDGKKWRCSRDVAPDHKYCERHLHRSRPRSRKPVELHSNTTNNNNNNNNNNKKTRHNPATSAESPVVAAISHPTVDNNGAAASEFVRTISQPCIQRSVFFVKAATFDANAAFVSTYEEPRNLNWMTKDEPAPIAATDDQQWHHLVQTEIGLATESFFNNASVLNQRYQEELLNLNSFVHFNAGKDQQSNQQQCTMFLDETPRGFIDAWSNGASDNHNTTSRNPGSISANGKLSLPQLTLSMGGNNSVDDKMGQIQMGLGLMETNQNHECGTTTTTTTTSTTPGGPLAEVVQLSTLNNATNQISSFAAKNGDIGGPATTVSSPSGVLQKTLASFSDSSSNSSPILASSSTKSEIALLWLNQGKLPSSS